MATSIRHLTPADYRIMPWKNGLGTTTEIAVDPPGAGLDAFAWRLSLAELTASGPFSSFPGVDRIILQTEGEPMELVHEGRGRHRLARLTPHRFEGEWATYGELATPPARDFNVMTRRDRVRAGVAVHELAQGSVVRLASTAETLIVHAFRGEVAVRAGEGRSLREGDTLIAAGAGGLELAAAGSAVAFVIELATVGAASVTDLVRP